MQRAITYVSLLLLYFSPSEFAYADFFEVTPTLYAFDYREFDQSNRLLDKEQGLLSGAKFSGRHEYGNGNLNIHAALYGGSVDYTGQTQSGIPHQTDTDTRLFNIGFRLDLVQTTSIPVQLFLGLQHWRWDRDILTRNNVQGLHEIYSWEEAELGARFDWAIARQSSMWIETSGLYVINPQMDLELPASDLSFHLGAESGYRLRTGISLQGNSVSLSVNAFVERWEFGRSNTIFTNDFFGSSAYLTEPASKSFHSGLELGFISRF